MAAIGGLHALNSVQNLCAIGQVKISASEFHQGDESVKAWNKEETEDLFFGKSIQSYGA